MLNSRSEPAGMPMTHLPVLMGLVIVGGVAALTWDLRWAAAVGALYAAGGALRWAIDRRRRPS